MSEMCSACGKRRSEVKKLIELQRGCFWACNECVSLWADIYDVDKSNVVSIVDADKRVGILSTQDIKDIQLPKTTKEFAEYLRNIATQVDRIPDRPLFLDENDVEVGFYYGHPSFPQMPTGLHFAVDFASTEYDR